MRFLATMATGFALAALGVAMVGRFAGISSDVRGMAATGILLGLGVMGGFMLALHRPGPWLGVLHRVVWLGLVPAWGFVINASLPSCTAACRETYEALAWPGWLVVAASYGLGLVALTAHLRRPTPQSVGVEALLVALLAQAALTCAVLSFQFSFLVPYALLFAPIGLPLVSPLVASLVLGVGAAQRVQRVGWQAGARGGALFVLGAGVWTLITRARGPYLGAFTQTCGWTLSQLTPPDVDCHYLCTVAAQGSAWLVRPLRWGRRRGRPILVNRQLAVANAFEDLLHERWPRFGAWARRGYDAWGRDVSRWVRHRWLANGVFLAMVPAAVGFQLFLLIFDPGDPEARVDRMYR